MGSRANYVLIENGQTSIFFTRWGAQNIPSVLLSGPEATLAYIHQLTPAESLLDNVWAEGGVLLDVDTHHVLFWGGIHISVRPYLRRPLLAVLPLLWPEWSVDWALFGVIDLARSIGCEISQVVDVDFDDTNFLMSSEAVVTEEQVLDALKIDGTGTILTIRWKAREVSDYLFFVPESLEEFDKRLFLAAAYQLLSLGPRLLTVLQSRPTISLPREGSEQEPKQGAYIDEETHTIWFWETETLDPRYLEALARRWPMWQVHGHVEGLVRHVFLSGRDSATVSVSDQLAIQELIEELSRDQGTDPLQIFQIIQQALPLEDLKEAKFGIGFFNADVPPLASEERRIMLKRLLSEFPYTPLS